MLLDLERKEIPESYISKQKLELHTLNNFAFSSKGNCKWKNTCQAGETTFRKNYFQNYNGMLRKVASPQAETGHTEKSFRMAEEKS